MILFKPYSSIKDFLARFTIIKLGSLHIRIHKISSEDKSTLYHNHPFNYISIILKGGYSESLIFDNRIIKKSHSFLSIIKRGHTTFHRITSINKTTYTLFIAYGKFQWKAFNTINDTSSDGLHQRTINNQLLWAKKESGIWFIGNIDKEIASNETRHSIHQIL